MLTIHVNDLIVEGKHGVHPEEKTTPQPFSISVHITLTDNQAAVSDDLKATIDWSSLRQLIIDTVQNTSSDLIEHLAQTIADKILLDKRARSAVITIDKLQAFETGVPGVRLEVKSPAAD